MKKLLFLILSFVLMLGCSSAMLTEEQMAKKEMIYFSGVSKEDIYQKSFQWMAIAFKSANTVVQYQNQKEGRIIVRGTMHCYEIKVNTVLIVDVRENQSRITVVPISFDSRGGMYGNMYFTDLSFDEKTYKSYEVEKSQLQLISDYKKHMLETPKRYEKL